MPADLCSLFADPPRAFRPQPFWFLNRGLDEPELRRQIAEMDDKGVGGAVLHCRHGLRIEYMSEDWLRLIGICVDELGQRGMEAWLYDEDDWPSGTVGGKLTRPHPEFRMRYLRVQELRVSGGVTFQATLEPDDNTLLFIQAWPYEEMGKEGAGAELRFVGEPRDITGSYESGRLQWNAPPGKWLVAVFWECPVAERVTFDRGYYLDTMNPEAVAAFRRMAYEPYERFREQFGATIKGVFTDEPGLMIHDGIFGVQAMRTSVQDPSRTLPGTVLAWTRDFLTRFEQLKGYDLQPYLLGLLYDIGPETTRLRCDYYDALTSWYVEAYHAQLSAWCAERGLEYIGHTLEDPLWGAARSQGNQIRVLEQFHRPGLDYLGHGVGTREHPFRILAAKCAASVAHVQGKTRVMCEAFGGSGHGHTLAKRRLDANFMACLGVNMFIPHGFYFSFQGFRKTDWPPTEFYHAPFWPWYRHFADYLARLALIQSWGHHISDACILQPMRTVQVDMFRQGESVREPQAQRLFDRVSDLMLRLHHDYDYLDESQLVRAQVRDGRIVFGQSQETYPVLILPCCRVLSIETVRFLKRLFEGGGRILALGELPFECTDERHNQELRELVAEVFGPGSPDAERRNYGGHGGVALFQPVTGDDLPLWLQQTMPQLTCPDVILDDNHGQPVEDLICCHRTDGERHTYLVVNRSMAPLSGTLRVVGDGLLERWDLETGRVSTVADAFVEGERLCCRVALEPGGALLLVVTPNQAPDRDLVPAPKQEQVAELLLSEEWALDVGQANVVILDRWEFVAADTEAGKRHGIGVPGQVNTYRTTFEVAKRPSQLRLVLDDVEQMIPSHEGFLSRRRNLEIYVNGAQAPPLSPSTWQDPYYQEVDITDLVIEGANTIEIAAISLLEPFEHLTGPAYLVGDFALQDGALAAPPEWIRGPFSEAGYPHFVGIARHTQVLDIPEQYLGDYRLLLTPGEVRDCCRVLVNGQEVGVRLWPPFDVDITGAARPGPNEIVVEVANSLANLYDKQSRTCGLVGRGRLRVMRPITKG